jgi:ankyrin repeat protein
MSRRSLNNQQALAREEIGQSLAEDSALTDVYDDGGLQEGEYSSMPTYATEGTADEDPAQLFSILEEGSPKQGEFATGPLQPGSESQKRRDLSEQVWDLVRRWMWTHPLPEQRQAAAFVRGTHDATSLHLMCKLPNPPPDVILTLVDSAPEIASWTDSHGWLPLHHACTNGASPEVLQILIDAYPAGKLHQDSQMRTPLHFYATRNFSNPTHMAANAELLSDTGAAALADKGGMLPMHYACAYGTDPSVLGVLAAVHPESLTAMENKGRTPMHLAMVNAHRDDIPNVIRFLLANPQSRGTINTRDQDNYLPLHLLALGLRGYRSEEPSKRNNVADCLTMYLDAEPVAAADFLTTIQQLPDWLQDRAVVTQHVRNVLNEKIVRPLPASILILDGYILIMIILCFGISTNEHLNSRFDVKDTDKSGLAIVFLFVGASYFLLRELVQLFSLIQLGSFSSWWLDAQNWLDVAVIFLVSYYAVLMLEEGSGIDNNKFRSGVAFTQGILYLDVIVYLKSTYVDFAVFVGGVLHVVQRLSAFLIAVAVILLAFAQMFYFIYVDTILCADPGDPECDFPHCNFEFSLLKVYTMMMGEIGNERRYSVGPTSLVAQLLYVSYAFLVVILLSNVLIAIVSIAANSVLNSVC